MGILCANCSGMSANVPTDICFSFTRLVPARWRTNHIKTAGASPSTKAKGCRTFRSQPSLITHPIAKLVQDYPIKSARWCPHPSRLNRGEVALENTHPFTRRLWGRNWTYAHSEGSSRAISDPLETGNFRPVGRTDSKKPSAGCCTWLTGAITPGNDCRIQIHRDAGV